MADVDHSLEIKRHLLFARKTMTTREHIKNRDIILPTKVYIVKAMDFTVVMCICESWTIKKVEHQRIDAFELWCWRRLLTVPLTARRSDQSILKESTLNSHWKDWAEAAVSVLWPLDGKIQLTAKDPDARKDWWQEEKGVTGDEMVEGHHQLNGNEFEETLLYKEGKGRMVWCSPWGYKESDMT